MVGRKRNVDSVAMPNASRRTTSRIQGVRMVGGTTAASQRQGRRTAWPGVAWYGWARLGWAWQGTGCIRDRTEDRAHDGPDGSRREGLSIDH